MNEEMIKSLASLIDESLVELEELKKSDRFSASEVKLGDDSGLAGKDKNGSMGKEDKETEPGRQPQEEGDTEEDDDEEERKKKKKADEAEKAEGKNSEADPNAGHHKAVSKDETGMPDDTAEKAEGKNSEADPNAGHHKPVYKSEDLASDLKKSQQETESLMKGYVDEKVGGLESKIDALSKAIHELANAPVPAKGASYKNVQPLNKSQPDEEPLSKSAVVNKLFDLKKSGEKVDSVDITSAELGSPNELSKIVNKYNIK